MPKGAPQSSAGPLPSRRSGHSVEAELRQQLLAPARRDLEHPVAAAGGVALAPAQPALGHEVLEQLAPEAAGQVVAALRPVEAAIGARRWPERTRHGREPQFGQPGPAGLGEAGSGFVPCQPIVLLQLLPQAPRRPGRRCGRSSSAPREAAAARDATRRGRGCVARPPAPAPAGHAPLRRRRGGSSDGAHAARRRSARPSLSLARCALAVEACTLAHFASSPALAYWPSSR